MSPIRRHVVIHGRVQGVFFRDTAKRMASARGVTGSIRNRDDGAVEAVFEGEPEGVEALVAFARDGPEGAHVERLEVSEEEPQGTSGFTVI